MRHRHRAGVEHVSMTTRPRCAKRIAFYERFDERIDGRSRAPCATTTWRSSSATSRRSRSRWPRGSACLASRSANFTWDWIYETHPGHDRRGALARAADSRARTGTRRSRSSCPSPAASRSSRTSAAAARRAAPHALAAGHARALRHRRTTGRRPCCRSAATACPTSISSRSTARG